MWSGKKEKKENPILHDKAGLTKDHFSPQAQMNLLGQQQITTKWLNCKNSKQQINQHHEMKQHNNGTTYNRTEQNSMQPACKPSNFKTFYNPPSTYHLHSSLKMVSPSIFGKGYYPLLTMVISHSWKEIQTKIGTRAIIWMDTNHGNNWNHGNTT